MISSRVAGKKEERHGGVRVVSDSKEWKRISLKVEVKFLTFCQRIRLKITEEEQAKVKIYGAKDSRFCVRYDLCFSRVIVV